jgi:catecholate siderophore receptor
MILSLSILLALASPLPSPPLSAAFVFHGRVVDPVRAPIAGARIVVVAADSPAPAATTVSDERGEFTLTLDPGRYTLTVAADGFVDASIAMTAAANGDESREFLLRVAGVRETVNVSAAPAQAGYQVPAISSSTKTLTPLRDVPQSVSVVTKELMRDQLMTSLADVVRYMPGVVAHQGENNRDQVIIRGNSSSADFFLDGVRDDVQYYRDLYNLERVEALKGSNAMIFGRGGGGGVINRVTKTAEFLPLREVTLQAGSFGAKRASADLDSPLNQKVAFRINALYENSDSFRPFVNRERYGVNPTLTFAPNAETRFTIGYEHFQDNRTADRGIPSFQGRPARAAVASYFGNPADSQVHAQVDTTSATLDRQIGNLNVRNRTLVGHYDRGYQNYVPGAMSADGTQVALSAYNNRTERLNAFNQTDVRYAAWTGGIGHTLLGGVEVGRQATDNFRNTGFFNNTTTSILVPFSAPTIRTPVTFRQSATDADNHLRATVAAVYGQDQIALSRYVQLVTGIRFDAFTLQYHNNRNGDDLERTDRLVSPRAAVVIKPILPLSLYSSYTLSYLPSSGDQFSSLTTITEQMKPEKFANYEIGAKWDIARNLAFTTAVYRLDRTNTRSTDPNDPTRIVQTGAQRTNGFETGLNGQVTPRWQIAGGYTYQNAFVTRATIAARAGAQVAQVPHHAFSFWNSYQVCPRVSGGLGVVRRTSMYAAIDNTVTLPGFTEVDGAVYIALTWRLRLQANVENLFNRLYYVNADSNTNISPASPRAVRIALVARF